MNPLTKVLEERARQDAKWGEQNHEDAHWLGILVEEVGEVAKAIIEQRRVDTVREVIHVCAVAVAWLKCVERKDVNTPF